MRHLKHPFWVNPVIDIARQAGKAILVIYEQMAASGIVENEVLRKADDSPLTQADLVAHEVICAGLAKLTPDVPVVSEEDKTSWVRRQSVGSHWLIDPLDGTKEFLARNGEFTVNIARIEDGRAAWGVVYAPVLDAVYWGGAGWGAWQQLGRGTPAKPLTSTEAGSQTGERQAQTWRVLASKSHLNVYTQAFISGLGATELIQAGSSLKFCRLAEGVADVYPRLGPTCEWDTAAAQAVLEGAGGCVLNTQDQPLVYGKAGVMNPHFVAWRSWAIARTVRA